MQLSIFEYYLVVVNILGFFLFTVNQLSYSLRKKVHYDAAVGVVVFFGGSAGVMLAILLLGKKAVKENMMFRVFALCMFVMQVVLWLIAEGRIRDEISLDFIGDRVWRGQNSVDGGEIQDTDHYAAGAGLYGGLGRRADRDVCFQA